MVSANSCILMGCIEVGVFNLFKGCIVIGNLDLFMGFKEIKHFNGLESILLEIKHVGIKVTFCELVCCFSTISEVSSQLLADVPFNVHAGVGSVKAHRLSNGEDCKNSRE